MRIDRLTVENFRCFEHFTLELDPRCNVLIGENASGKTALLDALAVSFEPWMRSLPPEAHTENLRTLEKSCFKIEDVRLSQVDNGTHHEAHHELPVVVATSGEVLGKRLEWSSVSLQNVSEIDETQPGEAPLRTLIASTLRALSDADKRVVLPLLGYYGSRRLCLCHYEQSKGVGYKSRGFRVEGYFGAFSAELSLGQFEEWMKWRSGARNEAIVRLVDEGGDPKMVHTPELDAIVDSVRRCIPNCRRFYYRSDSQELRVTFNDGSNSALTNLSDGYHNYIALVADIAWRCVQLNPRFGAEAPQKTEGLVMIDEIDLHLHPAWQREVLGRLLDAFPKVQFVVTTHSPQVIASAEPEWLRILSPEHDEALRVEHTHGKDTNTILQQIMGVPARPDWMQEKLDKLARRIDDDEFEEARELLDEIIEDLGDNDPKVVGLEWELSMARAGIHADD